MPTWKEIWEARRLDPARGSKLAQLMAADGLDTGFGSVGEAAWRDFARGCATSMAIAPPSSIFEVGCGAGAFLYEFAEQGCRVGGLDASPALIACAREAMSAGVWHVADAAIPLPPSDFVAACGVFLYFSDLDYAAQVLANMVAAAQRGLLVLDVPDLARREATEAARRGLLGEAAYAARYAGLEHRYYERAWFAHQLARLGLDQVRIEDQAIPGYANSAGRFNVFAWKA